MERNCVIDFQLSENHNLAVLRTFFPEQGLYIEDVGGCPVETIIKNHYKLSLHKNPMKTAIVPLILLLMLASSASSAPVEEDFEQVASLTASVDISGDAEIVKEIP